MAAQTHSVSAPAVLAANFDACWTGSEPVRSVSDWQRIVDAGELASVNGAFALAWREPDGSLALARDAIGERSLFYAQTRHGFVFASSIRELLAAGVPARLNLRAVAKYLTYAYLPGTETLVEGIHKLLPGELLRVRDGQFVSGSFWRLPPEPDRYAEENELRRALRAELEAAVMRRLPPAGTPLAASLSGGIDSSLVVALARNLHDGPLSTWSVSFGPEYPNELEYSGMVAAHCGVPHNVLELSPATVLRHLDESIALLSDPIGDPLTVPNMLLFREAAAHSGVMLNGEGGDPCFGGPKNLPMLLAELLSGGLNDHADLRARSYLRAHQKCYDDFGELLAPEVQAAIAVDPLERELDVFFDDARWRNFLSKLMAVNVTFKGAHHILPKVDALAAAAGVLPRSPLFDRAIVELAFAIPAQLKLNGSIEKYLLKEAVRDLLPAAIVDRPKSGMLVPVEGWFRGPLLPHARERLLDGLAPWRLFRPDYLERLLAGRLRGLRPRHGVKIWLLVTLESWLRSTFK